MSAKQILLDVAEKLAPHATLAEAIHELEFRLAVEEGVAELDAPSAQTDLADIVHYIAARNSDVSASLGYEFEMLNVEVQPHSASAAGFKCVFGCTKPRA